VRTKGVYAADITVGETRVLRGHWADRLPDIDADIAALAAKLDAAKSAPTDERIAHAIAEALGRPQRPAAAGRHSPPTRLQRGSPLALEFAATKDYSAVRLHYRRVNQAERWQSLAMQSADRRWRASIPGEYTQSPYALQYYFELHESPASATLYPGLGEQLTGQPYFVVRS